MYKQNLQYYREKPDEEKNWIILRITEGLKLFRTLQEFKTILFFRRNWKSLILSEERLEQ